MKLYNLIIIATSLIMFSACDKDDDDKKTTYYETQDQMARPAINVKWNETQFDTESRLKNEPDPVSEIHFTPGTPIFARMKLAVFF